ncbi:MAG: methyltransferase [Candidatus Aramenus sp.]|jgi:tRNA (guanine10-N2)-dimethyltransferase|nr:methyltransferase [Candidatus Aramenus sp.]
MKYAVLSADELFVSMAELLAIIRRDASFFTGVAVFDGESRNVARRSSTIKYTGEVLAISEDFKEIVDAVRGKCFSVKPNVIMGSGKDEFQQAYSEVLKAIKPSRNCAVLDLIFTDGVIIAGIREEERDTKSMLAHSKKPFSQSGTMDPFTSRLLVNLANPKSSICDPFVGLGSILLESAWMGYKCLGSDVDLKALDKARKNLEFFSYQCELLQSSATAMPYREAEAIVTDPPYGRSSSAKGESLDMLYEGFFFNSAELLREKGKLVFATGSNLEWRDKIKSAGLRVVSIHFIYLHKSLSRKIYVVEKP